MNRKILSGWWFYAAVILVAVLSAGCAAAPAVEINPEIGKPVFSGERAYSLEEEFVTTFPYRVSGRPESVNASSWLYDAFSQLGLDCEIDSWEVVNYSRPMPLRNVVCRLPGESPQEILIVAHHDIASTTIQGADNDGSGIAILLHLAEVFVKEAPLKYTLVFAATDAEEYGMLGSLRYIQTHPNTRDIVAGISLDNLGMHFYDGMNVELLGQFRRYGAYWMPLLARDAAQAGGFWQVYPRIPLDQMLDQAAPVSFMDQGPMVAAGVPALGFAGHVPLEYADLKYDCWHMPCDDMTLQSADTLAQSGGITEVLVRQLLTMDVFPEATGPYIYFEESETIFTGLPLWLIFVAFVGLFFLGSWRVQPGVFQEKWTAWRGTVPHFLGLWLPLVGSVLLMYLLVQVGLMQSFELYPATTKDPYLLNPRWGAIGSYLVGLGLLFWIGRIVFRGAAGNPGPDARSVKSLALLAIGLAEVYILVVNPFSLLFCTPLLFWFLLKGRNGAGKAIDVLVFLLGGLFFYAMFYNFGFQTLRYGFKFAWFLMNMFSIRQIGFWTAAAIAAIVAAGLSVLVPPVRSRT